MEQKNELLRTSYTDTLIKKDNKWQIKRVTLVKNFNLVFRKWDKTSETPSVHPISENKPNPLLKKAQIQVILKREAISTYSLLPLSALFVQTIEAKANPENEDEYISVFSGAFFLHNLEQGITQPQVFWTDE